MIRTLAHVATALATSAVAVGLWAAPLGLPAPLALAAPQAPAAAPGAPGPAAPQAPTQAASGPTSQAGLINLNAATAAELDALPETGKARIKHITDARPIRSIDDLAGPGMPASYVAMLKARATV